MHDDNKMLETMTTILKRDELMKGTDSVEADLAHQNVAQVYHRMKNYPEATKHYLKSGQLGGLRAGRMCEDIMDYAQALQHYEKGGKDCKERLGIMYGIADRMDEADKIFDSYNDEDPNKSNTLRGEMF